MTRESQREKNWKHLYLRSDKLARAKQLGFDYPRITEAELIGQESAHNDERLNVLFVCSRNQWRSPTAEKIWRSHPGLSVRSAGTSPNARRHVSADDIVWSAVIFVMEEKHKSRLVAEYSRLLQFKPLHFLDIPDQYKYMDPDLVKEIERSVGAILGLE